MNAKVRSLQVRAALIAGLVIAGSLAGCGTQSRARSASTAPPSQSVAARLPALGSGVAGVTLFVLPDQSKRVLTKPIRAAKHSIDLTMYLLTDHTMIHDLEYAHAKGITVRVLLEHQPFGSEGGSRGANQSAYDQLYAADIAVKWSPSHFRLTHEKTMVIDGTTAYILTLNYTYSAFVKNREFGVVDANADDAREAEAIFQADWHGATYAPRDPNLLVSPSNSRAGLLALIGRARHSVEVYAEEVQDARIEAALVTARRRGATVRLISNYGDATNLRGLAVLTKGGVRTRLLRAPYIHAKAIIVDDTWAFVGSENISSASLDGNRELGVLLSDRDAIARLRAVFEHDWAT
jgi:cardiolipin synthase A/B